MRVLNLLSLLGLTAVSVSATGSTRNCPAPYNAFTYSQTFGYDASNGVITGTFTPSTSNDASLTLAYVQLHVSKNCADFINNNQGPADDQFPDPTPVTLGSSTGQCPTTWYQPPFDDNSAKTGFAPQNYQAATDGVDSNPQAGEHAVYVASNNTFVFHMSSALLSFNPGADVLCYDFTYAFNNAQGGILGCDTGICIPPPATQAPTTQVPSTSSPTTPQGFSLPTTAQPVGVRGDPQFAGFQGQNFQVHGVAGNIYNIFSASNLQVNGEFVFLEQGHCDPSMNTLCYGHPGSYIGALGLVFGNDNSTAAEAEESSAAHKHGNTTRILISAGKWNSGLHIHVNNHELRVSKYNVNVAFNNGLVLRYINKSKLHIRTPLLSVVVTNSDKFLNLDMDLNDEHLTSKAINTCQWPSKSSTTQVAVPASFATEPSGLMGQTWCARKIDSHNLEAQIDDFTQQNLFSQ